eukprot:SAG22_NODE_243_length_14055_cov_3.073015_9_plen_190_part_00
MVYNQDRESCGIYIIVSGQVTLHRIGAAGFCEDGQLRRLENQESLEAQRAAAAAAGKRHRDYMIQNTYSKGQTFGEVEGILAAKTGLLCCRYCSAEVSSPNGAELLHLTNAAIKTLGSRYPAGACGPGGLRGRASGRVSSRRVASRRVASRPVPSRLVASRPLLVLPAATSAVSVLRCHYKLIPPAVGR